MTKDKEAIYRKLLYIGLVDIRNYSHRAAYAPANPWLPPLSQEEIFTYVAQLSDWLHDLAMHSAGEFRGWNERNDEYFALGYDGIRASFDVNKYPALIHDVMKRFDNLR